MAILPPLWFSVLASFAGTQDSAPAPSDPKAEGCWSSFLAASGSRKETPPITAFHLRADIVTREGVQTNELRTEYRFLAPDSIRFLLSSGREIGRSGPKQRDYWLKDKDEIVPLVGADHERDRRDVDRMLAVARNFVGLSDPAKLHIERCEILDAPPSDIGPDRLRDAKELRWLCVTSPDFALVPEAAQGVPAERALYRVELALMDSYVPRFVIVRQEPASDPASRSNSMLLELDLHQERDGYRIPLSIKVHALDPAASPAIFAARPAQDIWIEEIDLRPAFTALDFKPR